MSYEPEYETLSVRVPREMADRIKTIAAMDDRPLSSELRRLIRQRIDEKDSRDPNGEQSPVAA